VEVRRKAVDEWSSRLQDALRPTLKSPDNPTMGLLMENVQDALREVFEAAVAGAAAEEEMSRALDLGSESGMAAAVLRDESAVEMLVSAHQAILEAIRDLLVGFGYVGPLDRMEEMPRPDWTGDMTLIGCVGLLSANTHAAVTSRRSSVIGQSVWQDVMRSASKLKDVVGTFPESVFPTTSAEAVERVEGRIRDAWLGIDGVGELMGGRWGFGKTEKPMRMLEQSSITEAQKLKAELHASMRSIQDENFLDVLRIAAKYRDALVVIDVVSSIDLDGNDAGVVNGHRPETEDVRVYAELVAQARQTLQELDTARSQTDDESVLLLSGPASGNLGELCARLASSIASSFNSISDLLDIALEQVSIVNSGAVRGQIGIRSPRYMIARHSSARPPSMTSTQSRHSKRSDRESRRQRVRGLEEEFLDEEEERDRAGAMISAASDSQTSLAVSGQGQRAKDEVSAMSSTTSLAYQQMESDSGSNKGNRSSFMKFMRGRSSSEPDDGKFTRNLKFTETDKGILGRGTERVKPSNRKLAKILGEDLQSLPSVPVPLAPPETPWYLGEDYEPGDIVFDDKGGVKAGTLKALVARLTPHGSTGMSST